MPVCYAPGYAEDAISLPKEPIVVNGDTVEYLQEQKKVIGTGHISITYRDVVLTCDKITVDLASRDAEASGNVRITQRDAYFAGDKIVYNFDSRKGKVVNGFLSARPFYGRAKELEKEENKDIYKMKTGYVTTCDLDQPHYRIQARQVKIYLDDKIVADNILFFVNNVPVMYFPYWVQPLGKERKSHITVIPGQSKDWGYYVLTAYRYYINDRSKGDVLIDYRSKKGLAVGVNHYIDFKDVGRGAFKVYYVGENNGLEWENTGAEKTRYRYQYRHNWDITPDTKATVEFNYLSDPDVIKDYFYNEYEELGDKPDNYVDIITSKPDYTTEFLMRKRFNNFYDVVERLPEYKINILNYRIKDTSFYYSGLLDGVFLNHTYPSIQNQKDVSTIRVDTHHRLAYAGRLFRAWSVTPYAGFRETYYSRNKWGDTNLGRMVVNAGVDNSIKFYKIYNAQTNFAGLDINKLRHIITPTANYYFQHQPTISPDNLNQFDEIDALEAQNGILLQLENRLQTKRKVGDEMKSVDLATLIVSTDYQFRLDKDNTSLKSNKFKDVKFKLELVPYSWLYLIADMSVNTKKANLQNSSIDIVANGGEKWQLATSYRFEDVETGKSSLISLDGMYKINDKWKVRAYERFDAQKGSFEEQEYTIYRDLHCWVLELTYRVTDESNHTLWFMLKLKAFPDYPVGLRQTYSRPRFGNTSDTQQ